MFASHHVQRARRFILASDDWLAVPLFIFCLFVSSNGLTKRATESDAKPLVAILELQGSDIPPKSLRLWTDLLRARVIQLGGKRLEVMTAGNQEYLLKANGIDPLSVCDGTTCDVEILKNLAADFGFAGSVTKLANNTYLGTLELYDTTSGTALGAAELKAKSEEELIEVLKQQGALLCRKLPGLAEARSVQSERAAATAGPVAVRLGSGPAELPPAGEESVFVEFTSTPEGASLYAGERQLCQKTPCKKRLGQQDYTFRFQLSEHRDALVDVSVRPGQSPVHVSLQPTYALLRVQVQPAGIRVTVDGQEHGSVALASGIRLSAGAHEVYVDDPCYAKSGERVVLGEGGFQEVRLVGRVEEALLEVQATDDAGNDVEVEIFADGEKVGTNVRAVAVPVCVKKLEVNGGGGRRSVEVPRLLAGRRSLVEVRISSIEQLLPHGMRFAVIPKGTFTMGSPEGELGRQSNETQHAVTFTYDFAMGVTEVTQGQWKAKSGGTNPSNFPNCGDNCPVESVDWYSTLAYANALSRDAGLQECYTLTPSTCADAVSDWGGGDTACTGATFAGLSCTGYRLPTEAEWEFAYRAGTKTAYYSGVNSVAFTCDFDANLDAIGWYCGNANNTTHPVGGNQANAWGLYDMSGNVWEWTWDWYGTYPGVTSDYIGPETGDYRVLRGGSWRRNAYLARAAYRGSCSPGYRGLISGFRLTRTLP